MKESGRSPILAIVLLVVGLVVGFGVTKLMDNNNSNTQSNNQAPTSATKAADLRANLVALGVQHMQLTDQAVDAALDGSPNAKEVAADLFKNGDNIGAAVGSVYGKDAETTFNTVWHLHLNDFVKYAVADSKGDAAGKTAALSDIETGYTKPLAQYLAKANPNLSEATLESSLREHVDMTAQMIDDHVQGKYTDEANLLDQSAQHLNMLFSTLAEGIVKQFPAKF